MIPKIIHYCWFSEEKKPRTIRRCLDSWNKIMPDYNIKCWDKNSFDFESVPFVKEAMSAKKYAFASDYVRLYALYTEGGIYLDSDVYVQKKFDQFLSEDFFCGTERYGSESIKMYRLEAAIMGAHKGHPFIKKCMSYYETHPFSIEKAAKEQIMPIIISKYAEEYGYQYNDELQTLPGMTIFPNTVFTNTHYFDNPNPENLYAIHQNYGSWFDFSHRGLLFHLCKKADLMNVYRFIEKNRK